MAEKDPSGNEQRDVEQEIPESGGKYPTFIVDKHAGAEEAADDEFMMHQDGLGTDGKDQRPEGEQEEVPYDRAKGVFHGEGGFELIGG